MEGLMEGAVVLVVEEGAHHVLLGHVAPIEDGAVDIGIDVETHLTTHVTIEHAGSLDRELPHIEIAIAQSVVSDKVIEVVGIDGKHWFLHVDAFASMEFALHIDVLQPMYIVLHRQLTQRIY